MKQSMFTFIALAFSLTIISCGDNGDSHPPPPDVIGSWSGTFVPDGSFAGALDNVVIDINITTQNGESFEGTWGSSGRVTGYTNPSNDGRTLVDFSLSRGGMVPCCVPLFGCWERAYEVVDMYGYLENGNSVTDLDAYHRVGCPYSAIGELTLTRY